MNWIQVVYFKLKEISPVFAPAKAKNRAYFLLPFRQIFEWKHEISVQFWPWTNWIQFIRYLPVPQWSSFYWKLTSRPNSFHIHLSMYGMVFMYTGQFCANIFRRLPYGKLPYLRNYTIYSNKISYMFFSHPLGNVYEVFLKSEDFFNFRHKWVKSFTACVAWDIIAPSTQPMHFTMHLTRRTA